MKKHSATNTHGFTLIETIIYVALFGILLTGIFVSLYPLFTGAERLTRNIVIEGETAFITTKIANAIANTIISQQGTITAPAPGTRDDELVLAFNGNERYHFAMSNNPSLGCSAPLTCAWLTLEENNSGNALPLNAQRVNIENFSATHTAPTGGAPRTLEVSFTANGEWVGPLFFYPRF